MLEYRSEQRIQPVPRLSPKGSIPRITTASKLVSLETAVKTLAIATLGSGSAVPMG